MSDGVVGRYGYMIENLCLLIKGSLKGDPSEKLIDSCNPLGDI